MVKRLKDLKSGPVLVTTPSSQDKTQDKEVRSIQNAKRNLFGTLPVGLDEYAINKSNPLPGVNFSFHSPVKSEETIPNAVSIHESVSSALHQLPLRGDDDIAMTDNDDCYEQACAEDDEWLENISTSVWEGKIDDREMGGANSARVLRQYIIQSAVTRQRTNLQNDEVQGTTDTLRSCEILLELKLVCSPAHSGKAGDDISLCLLRDDW